MDYSALEPEAVQDAVRRCVEAGTLVEIFRATDESEDVPSPGTWPSWTKRVYPAGYVEDLFEQLHQILRGEQQAINAEAYED